MQKLNKISNVNTFNLLQLLSVLHFVFTKACVTVAYVDQSFTLGECPKALCHCLNIQYVG